MIITRADLREWRIGAVMYRWFLRHFPRGGSYADIHHALIEEGYTDWAHRDFGYGTRLFRKMAGG